MKTKIEIPDNLTPAEERVAIMKKLMKALPAGSKHKTIGTGVDIKELNDTIEIVRVSKEKPSELIACACCTTLFDKKVGKKIFTNIGGFIRDKFYCSESCRATVLSILGNRAAVKRKDISHAFLF